MTAGEWLLEKRGLEHEQTIARLLMVLIGFVVAMLGVIYAMHSNDLYLGILIASGGIASMYVGLPS